MKPEIKQINDKLNTLHKTLVEDNQNLYEIKKQSIDLINAIVALLSDTVEKDDLLREKRVQEERSRFDSAPLFKNTPAAYELINKHQNLFDFKFYWLKRILKTYMSWVVAITPNFEDNPEVFSNKNIGIDFVLSREKKTFYIILSHKFKLRVLELHDRLTQTQVEIFEKWLKIGEKIKNIQEFDQKSKLQIHNELWQSFDYEPTNRKFYEGLASYFKQLVHYLQNESRLELSEQEAKLFTTRLFNRLIFLWFLKKKNFLSASQNYFQAYENSTKYYKEKLEPLFFEVLNQEIKDRKKNGVQDLETPFLNGGLFTPEKIDLYKNSDLTFPEKFFTSLFSFLNHYNFTVDEGTSEYQQVAIDPEMLGRIFESLLAEFIEETGEQARKAKGAFYTPREIVDYMCEESLITYLTDKFAKTDTEKMRIQELVRMPESKFRDQDQNKRRDFKRDLPAEEIKESLLNLKILDPAVGSGAFPMGMLHLLVKVITRLDSKEEKNISKLKKQILSKALYGVDIENMAIQIARLRAWLSILVDMPENKVEPLPNFEFKFVCANTLIPLERSDKQIALFDDQDLKQKQIELINAYYNATRKKDKEKIKKEYLSLIHADKGGQLTLGDTDYNQKLKSYNPFDPANSTDFYDPELMHGVRDFDIIIGNPPYVQLQKDGGRLANLYKDLNYETFTRTGDIYALFYERGLQLARDSGYLIYITSNKWMRAGYGEKLRGYFAKKNPLVLIDFGGFKVFESATVDTNILLIQNSDYQNKLYACHFKNDYQKGQSIKEYFDTHKVKLDISKFGSNTWFIASPEEIALKEKIEKVGTPLRDWNIKINFGIKTGFNEAFIIDTETKDRLVAEDPKSAEVIKPLLRGRDIKRYGYEFADKWLINTHNGYTKDNGEKVPAINVEEYTAIKRHLDEYWERLSKRSDKGVTPYNLRDCAYLQEFEKEKIIYSEIVREPQFYFDDKKFFVEATAFIMTGEMVKMLTGIFNSKLFTYIFKKFYAGGGLGEDGYRYKKKFIVNVPVPLITSQNEHIAKQIESLVDQIQAAKYQNPNADTSDLENQIDELVFELYRLTDEERNIISSNM